MRTLERLSAQTKIHLLSFEKPEDWADESRRAALAERIRRAGIAWHPRRYHKRPTAPATAYDISLGVVAGTALVLRYGLRIVHARSYVPAAMAVAIKRLTGARFLFDMRGFWADERVDGGIWPKDGRLYRVGKGMERRFLTEADGIVSLTEAAVTEMRGFPYLAGRMPPVFVIPTCADLRRFDLDTVSQQTSDPFVLGYVGTVGQWYLFDEVLACFKILKERKPEARLRIVNRHQHDYIRERLDAAEILPSDVELLAADHAEMPSLIRGMSAGIMVARPAYSHKARAPTRLAEFLGCGVPFMCNAGIGDMPAILETERVGIVLAGFTDEDRRQAIDALLALVGDRDIRARCAQAAARHFSVEEGVARYRAAYAQLSPAA